MRRCQNIRSMSIFSKQKRLQELGKSATKCRKMRQTQMKNIGITKVMEWGIDDFVSDIGIKIRRLINPIFRRALKLGTKRKIIVEQYPKLKKDMPYIFAATHSFDDDIISTLSAIDRSAFLLTGCTDQIAFNPQMYAGWPNGMIYVDRLDPISRKESVVKMKKILEKGSSVLIFPEGGWNNTENLLIQPLFAGPYTLNRETGRLVVPIASFHEKGGDKIYIRAGNPMSFDGMSKDEGLTTLRDTMATMWYKMMEDYSTPLKRDSLRGFDHHLAFMEERRQEYLHVYWSRDVWEEELAFYHDKNHPRPKKVREFVDSVAITSQNAAILAPILARREEDRKYDFVQYMHENWNKD